jgi:hypothetical protein
MEKLTFSALSTTFRAWRKRKTPSSAMQSPTRSFYWYSISEEREQGGLLHLI